MRERLRALLDRQETLVLPGAHDALSAKIIEQAGFPAVYIGGMMSSAARYGIPDVGLLTTSEMLNITRDVVAAVGIPVIADFDDCGRSPIEVARTVRLCEQTGLAAIHIEDLMPAKHLTSHYDGLASVEETTQRIRAAVEARNNADFLIIGRTDAYALSTPAETIERCRQFAEAGADLLFIPYLGTDASKEIARELTRPLMLVSTESTVSEARMSGAAIVVYAGMTLQIGVKAMADAVREFHETGTISNYRLRTLHPRQFVELTGTHKMSELALRYGMLGGRRPRRPTQKDDNQSRPGRGHP